MTLEEAAWDAVQGGVRHRTQSVSGRATRGTNPGIVMGLSTPVSLATIGLHQYTRVVGFLTRVIVEGEDS